MAVEPNGWAGSIPEIARRLSAGGGYFFSLYWSPSAYQIMEAVDGKVTAFFDPIYVVEGQGAGQGELYPGWLTGREFRAFLRTEADTASVCELQPCVIPGCCKPATTLPGSDARHTGSLIR
ncbi:hypothetical protein [Actinokineospora sp.]|uniref:hypothetical protein n=1 Tax=Actinokineospora sp. TaxID=1872133 RepID=UPI004037D401